MADIKDPIKEVDKMLKQGGEYANIPKSHLFRMQVLRESQDVQTWRECLQVAERAWFPSRVNMQRMFADTLLDGHVIACINKRKNMLLQRDFFIGIGEKEDELLTKMFNTQWFSQIMEYVLDAKFFGYSFLNWTAWDYSKNKPVGTKIIPRENILVDRGGLYTTDEGGVTRVPSNIMPSLNFDDPKIQPWTMLVTTPNTTSRSSCGMGELYPVSLYAIFLRHNLGYNADFVERFMSPIVVGKTTKSELEERKEFLKDLQTFGSSAAIVLDMLDQIEFIESKNTGTAYNSFDNFETRLQKLISKILLGHADAMDSTPGKLGNNDNALEGLEEISLVDAKFVETVINDEFIPKLRLHYPSLSEDLVFKFTNNHELQEAREEQAEFNTKSVSWIKSLSDAGYELEEKEISDLLGFTVKKKEAPAPVSMGERKKVQEAINKLWS